MRGSARKRSLALSALTLAASLAFLPTAAQGKIYKWVDENGTVHFSDKPISAEAKAVKIKPTGIRVDKPEPDEQRKAAPHGAAAKVKPAADKTQGKTQQQRPGGDDIIDEDDYRITANVGEVGGDFIRISGRISSGPRCDSLSIKATAQSDTGLTANVTDKVRKINSFGSVTFEGMAKVSGSDDDFGFWEVSDITVWCSD